MAHSAARVSSIALATMALVALSTTHTARAADVIPHRGAPQVATSSGAWWGIDTVDNVQTGNDIAQTRTDLGARNSSGDISSTAASSRLRRHGSSTSRGCQSCSSMIRIARSRRDPPTRIRRSRGQSRSGFRTVSRSFAMSKTSDPISSAYIAAYVAAFAGSGYVAAFYENPINGSFAGAYCSLATSDPAAVRGVLLYSSEPEHTGSDPRRAARPHFGPTSPVA